MNNSTEVQEVNLAMLNIAVGTYYDFQVVRQATMNRIRDIVRKLVEGIPLNETEDKKDEKDFSKAYADDKLPALITKLYEENKISKEAHKRLTALLKHAKSEKTTEEKMKREIGHLISQEVIWEKYLGNIRGVGPMIAANLTHMLGYCETFDSVSAVWRYFGLHVVCPVCTEKVPVKKKKEEGEEEEKEEFKIFSLLSNNQGKCPKCNRNCIAPRRRKGKGVSLDFNPNARKLSYIIADCLMKARSPIFRQVYDDIKTQEEKRNLTPRYMRVSFGLVGKMVEGKIFGKDSGKDPDKLYIVSEKGDIPKLNALWGDSKEIQYYLSKGHIHARAMRKVSKLFLSIYWVACRELTGQTVTEPYVQSHLGHQHILTWKEVLEANNEAAA